MKRLINILLLEDDPEDAELIQATLESENLACRMTRVQTRDGFREELSRGGYDVVLADYRLPVYNGISALKLARESFPEVPFIIVSGVMGEDAAIEGLTEGATDYVLKQKLQRLAPAVRRAIREAENCRERKRAEAERQAHLLFLESMDRINRAIQEADDPGQIMNNVLSVVLSVFNCDRVYLGYPCDPETASWKVEMECTSPEYPGALTLGPGEIPVDTKITEGFRIIAAADGPVKFDPDSGRPLPPEIAKRFNLKSSIAMALHPRTGRPWSFGIHQCSYPRVWTSEEARLFEEIGRRISDALNIYLVYRNLKESEQRFRDIFDNSLDAMCLIEVTEDGRFRNLEINPAMEKITGIPGTEMIGKYVDEMVSEEPAAVITERYRRCLAAGGPVQGEVGLSFPAGRHFFHCIFIPLRNDSGRIHRIVDIRRDITEYKRMERELFHAKRLEIIGQLAGGVAHEVRNPLNAILSISEAFFREEKIVGNPEYQPYIEHIRTQVNRLSKLMTDLLELGKPIRQANVHAVPLDELFMETIRLWKQTATGREHPLTFECDTTSGNPLVDTDGTRLQQVLFNLIDNAGQSTPRGGQIDVHVTESGGGKLSVQVKDTGKGVPEDKIHRVFDPFFSLRKGGTGLGLTLVKHFIENMGGEVKIRNNDPPPGCTVELILDSVQKGVNKSLGKK